jgi:hypothetical protein
MTNVEINIDLIGKLLSQTFRVSSNDTIFYQEFPRVPDFDHIHYKAPIKMFNDFMPRNSKVNRRLLTDCTMLHPDRLPNIHPVTSTSERNYTETRYCIPTSLPKIICGCQRL